MVSARGAEEVCLAPAREHQVVAVDRSAVVERHRPRVGVGRGYVALHELDRIAPSEKLGEIDRHVVAGQLESCYLIEQRQELMVVVPVDQRDPSVVGMLRQLVRAPEPGESTSDDDDVRLLHHHDPSATEMPQRPRHDPPGSSSIRSTPVRNALGGHVIGSIAMPARRRDAGSSVSPV